VTIGIMGKYVALRDAYASVMKALEHSGVYNGVNVNIEWINTTDVDANNIAQHLAGVQGIIVPGGFGSRGTESRGCKLHDQRADSFGGVEERTRGRLSRARRAGHPAPHR
jgi:CTP synthase